LEAFGKQDSLEGIDCFLCAGCGYSDLNLADARLCSGVINFLHFMLAAKTIIFSDFL